MKEDVLAPQYILVKKISKKKNENYLHSEGDWEQTWNQRENIYLEPNDKPYQPRENLTAYKLLK